MLPARRLAALFGGDPRLAAETAGLLVSLGYLTRFVTLTDVAPVDEQPGLRRHGPLRRWLRRSPLPVVVDEDDPVWAERWGWASAPSGLSLRALFDAIWRPASGDSRQEFPSDFLDAPLRRTLCDPAQAGRPGDRASR